MYGRCGDFNCLHISLYDDLRVNVHRANLDLPVKCCVGFIEFAKDSLRGIDVFAIHRCIQRKTIKGRFRLFVWRNQWNKLCLAILHDLTDGKNKKLYLVTKKWQKGEPRISLYVGTFIKVLTLRVTDHKF